MESDCSKRSVRSEFRFFQDDSCSGEFIPEIDAAGNLHSQFKSIREMLEYAEDSSHEDDFIYAKNRLTKYSNTYSDVKSIEIGDLQKIINIHNSTIDEICDRIESHSDLSSGMYFRKLEANPNDLQMQKYKSEIKSLRFDLEVMEGLYKDCFDEMMNQEKTINSLREACLDRSLAEFDLKIDNEMLVSQLSSKHQCPSDKKRSVEIKNELYEIESELNSLRDILSSDILKESERKDAIVEELKKENVGLKNEIFLLRKEIENLKRKSDKNRTRKSKNIRQMLNIIGVKLKYAQGYLMRNSCRRVLRREFLPIKYHLLEFREENENLKEENRALNDKIANLNRIQAEDRETAEDLRKKLENSEESLERLLDKYRTETDRITWLESSLFESTAKGKELCSRSDDVFECVQRLLKRLREEKRNISEKKAKLQNVLRFLVTREDLPRYMNVEDFLKN